MAKGGVGQQTQQRFHRGFFHLPDPALDSRLRAGRSSWPAYLIDRIYVLDPMMYDAQLKCECGCVLSAAGWYSRGDGDSARHFRCGEPDMRIQQCCLSGTSSR